MQNALVIEGGSPDRTPPLRPLVDTIYFPSNLGQVLNDICDIELLQNQTRTIRLRITRRHRSTDITLSAIIIFNEGPYIYDVRTGRGEGGSAEMRTLML